VRRAAPLLAVLTAAVLTVSGCGGSVHPRAASANPVTSAGAEPAPTDTPAGASPSAGAASPSASASGKQAPKPTRTTAAPAPTKAQAGAPRGPVTAPGPAGSIRHTGSDGVALTFDDGPDPKNTMALLDLLKEQGVKATFCVVGFRARDNPQVIKRIVDEGHTICNHSWQHLENLSEREDSYLMWDLESTNNAIHAAAPGAKIQYFRAPYGNFTPRLIQFAARFGLKPIHWDVDDECYVTNKYGVGPAMANHMTTIVQRDTRPGSIILSHENLKPHTVATYRTLLPWLKSRFQLIALPTG
jgi:peptidoglycan/xylan/chitin deacetylase (PgdA/CDA1 family)